MLPARTAIEASRDLLATQRALQVMDEADRQMRTVYAGCLLAHELIEFRGEYVQWLTHRWFAEQWLAQQRAANDSCTTAALLPGRDPYAGAVRAASATSPDGCLPAVDRQCGGSQKPNGGTLDAPVKAGSYPQKGDQARFERAREGMDAGSCERQPVRGNGAPALVTLPHYASPDGGPMGAGYPAAAGPTTGVKPAAARHAHADDTHRPRDPMPSRQAGSSE